MFFIFMAPLIYWYITIPEILYIIYAGFRSVANDGPAQLYFISLSLYFCTFIADQKLTMAVTAVLIVIDFLLHRHWAVNNTHHYTPSSRKTWSSCDDCPYCGSSDTDGNHCYNCGKDF